MGRVGEESRYFEGCNPHGKQVRTGASSPQVGHSAGREEARLGLTGSHRKDAVNNHHNFLEDDDNDTALFERLQQQALDNCPNPERVGCPSPSVLSAFVDNPASVTPAELNDLHILKCAECTGDLMDLRRKRESGRPLKSKSSLGRSRLVVLASMVVAVLCGILVTTTVHWKGDHLSESKNAIPKAVTLAKTIDLSRYGATRGMEQEQQSDRAISLPRATIDLDLILASISVVPSSAALGSSIFH
jgi:hypothetical protein